MNRYLKTLIKRSSALALVTAFFVVTGCSNTSVTKRGEKTRQVTTVDQAIDTEFRKGIAYMEAGRDREAENAFLNITRSQPQLAGPYANLGLVYLKTDRLEEAEKAFQKITELQPENPDGYNYLGVVYRTAGDFDKAETSYEKALQADPNFAPAHLNLGILYDLYSADLDKALIHYQKYQQLNGTEDQQVKVWIADVQRRGASVSASPDAEQESKEDTP